MNIRKIQRVLAPLLQPLAYPYAYITRRRRFFYTQGYKKSFKPGSITISVGNIAAGGTGKTPLTSWLLHWANRFAFQTVVLTRGYGGKTGGYPVVVSSGTNPSQCGDEPLLLARKHPEATIIAFPKRRVSMQLAERFLAPDLVVLDDGMQHLAIQRDIDFVVLKENDLKDGWNKVIPAGEWREDVSALEVADAFFIKANPQKFSELHPVFIKRLGHLKKPLFSFEMVVAGLARIKGFCPHAPVYSPRGDDGNAVELAFTEEAGSVEHVPSPSMSDAHVFDDAASTASLATQQGASNTHKVESYSAIDLDTDYIPVSALQDFEDYILVSGVGEPKQVIETVTACLGKAPKQSFCYPDHYSFSTSDILHIESHKLPVICTEKDAVKLEQFILSVPFYALDVSIAFGESCMAEMPFEEWLQNTYDQLRHERERAR